MRAAIYAYPVIYQICRAEVRVMQDVIQTFRLINVFVVSSEVNIVEENSSPEVVVRLIRQEIQ